MLAASRYSRSDSAKAASAASRLDERLVHVERIADSVSTYNNSQELGGQFMLQAMVKASTAGDTARVLVLSPIEGTALVTVEREKVLRSFMVQLKADNPVIEIPLSDEDAPNAYVSVLIVKGAQDSARKFKQPQLRLGYCELLVENQRDKLAVALDPPAESYRPGEEVALSGTITLTGGKPAVGAATAPSFAA